MYTHMYSIYTRVQRAWYRTSSSRYKTAMITELPRRKQIPKVSTYTHTHTHTHTHIHVYIPYGQFPKSKRTLSEFRGWRKKMPDRYEISRKTKSWRAVSRLPRTAKRCNLADPKIRGSRGSLSGQSTCPYGYVFIYMYVYMYIYIYV